VSAELFVPEARERASGMASYAALSAFGLRRCAPQEPNARAAGSVSSPRLKARIEPPRRPLSSPLGAFGHLLSILEVSSIAILMER